METCELVVRRRVLPFVLGSRDTVQMATIWCMERCEKGRAYRQGDGRGYDREPRRLSLDQCLQHGLERAVWIRREKHVFPN